VRARILGYDRATLKVFYELKSFDESGEPPKTYFFDLLGPIPAIPTHAESLDDWEGDFRVRTARQRWLEIYPRLVPLHGLRDTEFTVRVRAESTDVDTNWNTTRFAARVEIRTPAGVRTFDLHTFCQPVVRVQGVYNVPGRQELLVIMSYIGRGYGCEEVELPVLFVPRSGKSGSERNDLPAESEFGYYEDPPVVVTRVDPVPPEVPRSTDIDWEVLLRVLVGKDGCVKNVRVFRGVTGLNEAAVDAVRRWVFKPAISNNKPVAAWIEIPIHFRL